MDEERRRRQTFFHDLEAFFRKKWNTTLKSPHLNGYQIDLYGLYKKVTALGGWNKVSTSNKWREVAQYLRLPKKCYGAEHATKMIYMKYLARFEQQQVFGEDHDDGSSSGIGGSRSSRSKAYSNSGAPSLGGGLYPSFSRGHMSVPDNMRFSGGFATDLVRHGPYERLIRSLQSGLPNEIDFALNLCLVMSNSNVSANFANSQQASMLIDLLLAHIGFFDEGQASYESLYQQAWTKHSNNLKFIDFWRNSVEDCELEDLLEPLELGPKITDSEKRTLNLTQEIGAHNPVSQKIILAGNIFRNFSFDSDFRSTLTSNRSILKYILMCINSKYAVLQNLGWDTLSNLSPELSLEPFDSSLTQILFRTLHKSLNSSDKFCIIRALETIGNLCSNEHNESVLCEFLEPTVLRRLIALLAVKDIMMCVYLLECLYSVSEMGHIPCQRIAEQPKAIDTLVSLVTVEAVSFGPSGLMGMKVVEFGLPQPHTAILPQPFRSDAVAAPASSMSKVQPVSSTVAMATPSAGNAKPQPSSLNTINNNNNNPASFVSSTISQQSVPPPFMAKPVRLLAPATPVVGNAAAGASVSPSINLSTQQTPIVLPTNHVKEERISNKKSSKKQKDTSKVIVLKAATSSTTTTTTPVSIVTVPAPGCPSTPPLAAAPFRGPAVMVQQDQHIELVASNWLKQNCTADPASTTSRAELYTAYVHKIGQTTGTMAVSINTFTTLIRQNFPSCQLRQVETANCKTSLVHVEGLKYTPSFPPAGACQPQPSPQFPCTAPVTTPTKSPVSSSIVASQHPLTQQILLQKSIGQFSPIPVVGVQCAVSPAPSGANSPSVNSLMSRGRSDSIGTTDSYSLPPTPDSTSSPRLTSGNQSSKPEKKNKSKKRNLLSDQQQHGSNNSKSVGSPGAAASDNSNCHLDVCRPAQEAQAVVETGDNHEALIVRIENAVGSVLSKMVPSSNEFTNKPNVNGRLESDSSPDNSRHSATSSTDCTGQQHPTNNNNSIIVSLLNKKSDEKLTANINGVIKSALVNVSSTLNNNNIAPSVTPAQNNNVGSSIAESNSRTQSPSPDMESMKLNLQKQQQNIQQLLMSSPAPPTNDTSINTIIPTMATAATTTTTTTTTIITATTTITNTNITTDSCSANTSLTAEEELLDSVVTAVFAEKKRRINEQLMTDGALPPKPKPKQKKVKSYKNPPIAVDEQLVNNVIVAVTCRTTESESNDSGTIMMTSAKTSTLASSSSPLSSSKKAVKRKSTDIDPSISSSDDTIVQATPTPSKKKKSKKTMKTVESVVNHVSGINLAPSLDVGQQTPPAFRPPLAPQPTGSSSIGQTPPVVNQTPVQYVATIQQGGATAQIVVRMPPPVGKLKYVCEWDNCEKAFDTISMVSYHVAKVHILSDPSVTSCKWTHCDKTPRLTWSLIAHVQDVHCNERVLRASAVRRYEISLSGHSNIPEPKSPPPHPGYPMDAALAAIRRHALVGLAKDVTEENEGPVTKSIRLASALTLRNLARYSSEGRHLLRKYESSLSWLAMSRLESCTALAQCLAELYSPVTQVSNGKSESEYR